jgi:hypothetical protein
MLAMMLGGVLYPVDVGDQRDPLPVEHVGETELGVLPQRTGFDPSEIITHLDVGADLLVALEAICNIGHEHQLVVVLGHVRVAGVTGNVVGKTSEHLDHVLIVAVAHVTREAAEAPATGSGSPGAGRTRDRGNPGAPNPGCNSDVRRL